MKCKHVKLRNKIITNAKLIGWSTLGRGIRHHRGIVLHPILCIHNFHAEIPKGFCIANLVAVKVGRENGEKT